MYCIGQLDSSLWSYAVKQRALTADSILITAIANPWPQHEEGRCFGSSYNFDRHLWSPAKLFTLLFENIRCAHFGSLRREIHVFVTPTQKIQAKILTKQHRSQLKHPNKAKKRYYPWGNHTYFKISGGAWSGPPLQTHASGSRNMPSPPPH